MIEIDKTRIGDVVVKYTDTHLHLQQNDQVTGFLHWVTMPIDSVKELKEFLNKIEQ